MHTAGNTKSQDTQLGYSGRKAGNEHQTRVTTRSERHAVGSVPWRRPMGAAAPAAAAVRAGGTAARVRPHGVAPPVLAVARVQPDADPVREGPTRSAEPWVGGPPPARSARWSGIASDS